MCSFGSIGFIWLNNWNLPLAQNHRDIFKIKVSKCSTLLMPSHQAGCRCQKIQVKTSINNWKWSSFQTEQEQAPETLKAFYLVGILLWLLRSSPLVQPEEEKAARGPYKCLQISEGWVSGGWSQALFSGAQWQDKGQRAQTEAQEVPSEHEEELLPSEGDRALE